MGKRAEMISLGRISDHVNNSGIRLNNQHVMELRDQLYVCLLYRVLLTFVGKGLIKAKYS